MKMRDAIAESSTAAEKLLERASAATGQPRRRVRLSSGCEPLLPSVETKLLTSLQSGDHTNVVFSLHARSAEQVWIAATASREPLVMVSGDGAGGGWPAGTSVGAAVVVVLVVVEVDVEVDVLVLVLVVVEVLVVVVSFATLLVALCVALAPSAPPGAVLALPDGAGAGVVVCGERGAGVAGSGSAGSGTVSSAESSSRTRCANEAESAQRRRPCSRAAVSSSAWAELAADVAAAAVVVVPELLASAPLLRGMKRPVDV